jgi:hypothetical protein
MDEALTLRFTRVSDDEHRFEYRRPDGTGEAIELESRETLLHDLLHFAVETEAGLRGSFYGLLAKVGGYAELSVGGGAALGGEIAITERLVAVLAEALREPDPDVDAFVAQTRAEFELYGERAPRWFNPDLVARVLARMGDLEGRWRATGPGETLQLSIPLAR